MHKGRRLSYFTSHHGVINCQRDYCATSYSCKTCSNVGAVDIFEQNFASYFFWFLISSLWSKWECLFIPPHMIFVWKKSIHRSDSTFNCVSPPFYFGLFLQLLLRDQREWVFEIREVKSEKEKLSLFFEKCKVKKKCFHSFSRSAKWKKVVFLVK